MTDHYPPLEDDEESALQRAVDSALRVGHQDFHRIVSDSAFLELTNPIGARGKALGKLENKGGGVPSPGLDSRYEVCGELGRGGIGRVLRAVDSELDREIAIKVLLEEHQSNRALIDRFIQEAQICSQLTHPSILPVYEIGQWSTLPFFTMKLVEGENLGRLLATRANPQDDLPRFVSIFEQICQAVAHAHSRSVIHRDLKPANVMVGRFGEVQLMDWGMAKVLKGSEVRSDDGEADSVATARSSSNREESVAGAIMGTLAYLAPEQAQGRVGEVDERSDVFGLGAILCEILTGGPPYVGTDEGGPRRAACEADLADAMARLDDCGAHDELIGLARRCLRAVPSERPPDASVLAAEVSAYLAGVEERARAAQIAAALAGEKATAAKRVQRLTLVIAGSVLLMLLFAGGFLWIQSVQDQQRAALESSVREDLAEVRGLQRDARAAVDDILAAWEKARERLAHTATITRGLDVGDELRASIGKLERELRLEYQEASRLASVVANDDRMTLRLEAVAVRMDDGRGTFLWNELARTRVAGYTKAFADYGIELWDRPLESVAEAVRSTRITAELITALDDWAAAERTLAGKGLVRARWLGRIAAEVDSDEWRQKLRARLLEDKIDLNALEALARDAKVEELSDLTIRFLVRELRIGRVVMPEAIQLLERCRLRHRSSFVLAVELGLSRTYSAAPDWAAIERAFRRALAIKPDSVTVLMHLGQALQFRGEFDAAIATCREALRIQPECATAYFQMGEVEVARHQLATAIAYYRRAVELAGRQNALPPDRRAVFHNNFGLAHYKRKDLDEAATEYRLAIALAPRWALPHSNLGLVHQDRRKCQAAIAELEKAIELNSRVAIFHLNLGNVLRKNNEFDRAIEECNAAITLRPKWAPPHYNLALAYKGKGQLGEAIRAFKRALELQPSADTFNELGIVLASNEQYEAAIDAFKSAIKSAPDKGEQHVNLALVYERTGRLDLAIREFETGSELLPHSPQPRIGLGNLFTDMGRFDDAIRVYRAAIRVAPGLAQPRNGLGYALELKGDLPRAIEAYSGAIERARVHPLAYLNRGMVNLHEGHYEAALQDLSRGYRFSESRDPQPSLALLRAFVERGEQLDAIIDGNDTIEDLDALTFAGQLAYYRGRHVAAVRVWRTLFATSRRHAEDMESRNRVSAIRSATLAATGQGMDESDLTTVQRAELRAQAVEWLRSNLSTWRTLVSTDAEARPQAIRQLRYALERDSDLKSIRDAASLEKLPSSEREVCEALWLDYRTLLKELEKRP